MKDLMKNSLVYQSVGWEVILNSMGINNDEIIFLPNDSIKICRDRMKNLMHMNQQLLGTYGNAIVHNVYQCAVILIEVPPWGDTPRTIASESDNREPEKEKQLYQHLFDEDSKKVYCWIKRIIYIIYIYIYLQKTIMLTYLANIAAHL